MRRKTFSHSGKIGDVIYAIPAMAALGGGELRLWTYLWWDKTRSTDVAKYATGQREHDFMQLLARASFGIVSKAGDPADGSEDVKLDEFHKYCDAEVSSPNDPAMNLVDMHLVTQGLPPRLSSKPWLDAAAVRPMKLAPIVFSRSPRYHDPEFPWLSALHMYRRSAVFVGLREEHRRFCSEIGPVDWYPTDGLADAARIIAGAKVIVGNQNAPMALAQGMGLRAIQETSPVKPYCMLDDSRDLYRVKRGEDLPNVRDLI